MLVELIYQVLSQKYLKLLPPEYYTDDVIDEIAKILSSRDLFHQINAGPELNQRILRKHPKLLSNFTISVIHEVIVKEVIATVENNGNLFEITEKYGTRKETLRSVISGLKKSSPEFQEKIDNYLNNSQRNERHDLATDLKRLEKIIASLGSVNRRKMTTDHKLQIAYLTKKYLTYSLEELYRYNNSARRMNVSHSVNYFIEYTLDYCLYVDIINGIYDVKEITYNNEWLKDFDFNKFFNMKDGKPVSTYTYTKDKIELTPEKASEIISYLKMQEIPLNILIVTLAFRAYFNNELETYIKKLHCFDNVFKESKKRKKSR